MYYTVSETIQETRESIRSEFCQTVIDEMDDEDLIMFALRFLRSNADEEFLL